MSRFPDLNPMRDAGLGIVSTPNDLKEIADPIHLAEITAIIDEAAKTLRLPRAQRDLITVREGKTPHGINLLVSSGSDQKPERKAWTISVRRTRCRRWANAGPPLVSDGAGARMALHLAYRGDVMQAAVTAEMESRKLGYDVDVGILIQIAPVPMSPEQAKQADAIAELFRLDQGGSQGCVNPHRLEVTPSNRPKKD